MVKIGWEGINFNRCVWVYWEIVKVGGGVMLWVWYWFVWGRGCELWWRWGEFIVEGSGCGCWFGDDVNK